MKENKGIASFGENVVTLLGELIKVGDIAPNFSAVDKGMKPVSLSDYKGKTVIISSFPSIDTGVCAAQTREFNKEAAGLSDNIVILSISKDLPFALGRFCGAEGIDKVQTLSDFQESDFGLKYGFLIKENKLLTRGVVVINPEGEVVYVEYVKNVFNEPDYSNAIEAAKKALL
jgi:thiol peroxidase